MLTWDELMSFSSLEKADVLRSDRRGQILSSVKYVFAPMTLAKKSCLYLVDQKIIGKTTAVPGISLILLGGKGEEPLPKEISNAAVLAEPDFSAFQNELQASEERVRKCGEEERILLSMLTENKGLNEMAREVTRWLERPVGVIDMNYQFLARTMEEEMDRSVSESDLGSHGVSEARLVQLYKDGITEKILRSEDPFYLEVDNFTIYQAALRINGIQIGALGITGSKTNGNDRLFPEYVHELPAIAELFSIELAKNEMYVQNGQKNLAYIFSMILENEPEDIESVRNRMRIYQYHLLSDFYLLYVPVVRDSDSAGQRNASANFIAGSLQNVFTNSIYLIRQDDILFLISRPGQRNISEFERNVWDSQLRRMKLHGGLSSVFTSFQGIRHVYLKQAKLALSAGKAVDSDRGLYCFEDYQVDALLADAAEASNLKTYCFPPLMRLIQYDWQKKLNLIETLRVVLSCKGTRDACEKLFIHKNTLYKRIAKIEEIMGCSISDPEVIMKIQLTFHILRREPE